jgi:PAH dioxygenase small subunit
MELSDAIATSPVDANVLARIERFLFRDAALLDRRDYPSWWNTVADDIQYRVTAKVSREAAAGHLETSITDERAAQLKQRLDQISTPKFTQAENPPSITRRFVTNIMANSTRIPNEFEVSCNLLVYRTSVDLVQGGLYAGLREDTLRDTTGQLRLVKRVVHLDNTVLFGAISILF